MHRAGEPLLRAEALAKVYEPGNFWALRGIDLSIDAGEMVAVTGASGSGKSTFLHLCGGLEQPSSGRLLVRGDPLPEMDLDRYRAMEVGFIFQSFHLIEVLTVLENVQVPFFESSVPRSRWKPRALELLSLVGMSAHVNKVPSQLSGGERQRAAIARSLVNEPALLLADEPTGNLDSQNSARILELLGNIHRERGATVVIVTHDPAVAACASRCVRLQDGRVIEDLHR